MLEIWMFQRDIKLTVENDRCLNVEQLFSSVSSVESEGIVLLKRESMQDNSISEEEESGTVHDRGKNGAIKAHEWNLHTLRDEVGSMSGKIDADCQTQSQSVAAVSQNTCSQHESLHGINDLNSLDTWDNEIEAISKESVEIYKRTKLKNFKLQDNLDGTEDYDHRSDDAPSNAVNNLLSALLLDDCCSDDDDDDDNDDEKGEDTILKKLGDADSSPTLLQLSRMSAKSAPNSPLTLYSGLQTNSGKHSKQDMFSLLKDDCMNSPSSPSLGSFALPHGSSALCHGSQPAHGSLPSLSTGTRFRRPHPTPEEDLNLPRPPRPPATLPLPDSPCLPIRQLSPPPSPSSSSPTCDGIHCSSPITRPKTLQSRTSSLEDSPTPGPSNAEVYNLSMDRSSRQNSENNADPSLQIARDHMKVMIDRMRQFVPLKHPNPDNMQLDELQLAILDFRYLEQALLDPEDYLDYDDYGDLNLEMMSQLGEKEVVPTFPRGLEATTECLICCDEVKLHKRICCDFPVCDTCMEQYIETNVNQGIVKIQCLGDSCETFLYRDEILGRLSVPMKDKYYKFLVDANKDPKVKTCPQCSNIHEICDEYLEQTTKYGLLVTCPECRLDWCFECQAPWHTDVKCKEFRKGDKLVKSWAKEKHYGTTNAQRCPKCKIFIERKGGCDHMMCSKCDTSFCYKCGGRYLDLKFFGNHLSRYSPLGCKYNFKADKPVLRKLIRGSVFGAKLLGGVVLAGLGVAAVGVLIGASVIILPAFGGYKYHKYRKLKRHQKRQQELIKMRSKNAMMELHKERLYSLDPRTLRERDSFWEALVREEAVRRSNRSTDRVSDSVHIGIQTGLSQQVDVTVHNPYQPDVLVDSEDSHNSEIRMNITDERGQVTVTTAEISHSSNTGEGSEAEIVLHVKTSYPKHEKDTNIQSDERTDESLDKQTKVDFIDISKSEVEPKSDVSDLGSISKANISSSWESRPMSAQIHRRAHSTGNVKKNMKKQEFGSISRKWRLKSAKRSIDGDNHLTADDSDQSGSLSHTEDKKPSGDQHEKSEIETPTQSGCFLKIFGKKLNTLQNQIETEKQLISKPDMNIGVNCPDVVSCALEAGLKSSLVSEGQGVEVKVTEKDSYFGLISKENNKTSL